MSEEMLSENQRRDLDSLKNRFHLSEEAVNLIRDDWIYGLSSEQTKEYYSLGKRNDVRESAKRLRRQYLRYKDAEIVYSIQHKKLLEMAGKAGAIYRIDGTVLINRDIFDQYLEQFHEPSTLTTAEETK